MTQEKNQLNERIHYYRVGYLQQRLDVEGVGEVERMGSPEELALNKQEARKMIEKLKGGKDEV